MLFARSRYLFPIAKTLFHLRHPHSVSAPVKLPKPYIVAPGKLSSHPLVKFLKAFHAPHNFFEN
jgi:hypothetical protein